MHTTGGRSAAGSTDIVEFEKVVDGRVYFRARAVGPELSREVES
jgi:hypothetical protein